MIIYGPFKLFTQRDARPVFRFKCRICFRASPLRTTATRLQLITSPISERSIIYPTSKARHSHGELRGASTRVCAPACRDDAPASRGGISSTGLHQSRGPWERDNNCI